MSEATYNVTSEDIRKMESKEAKFRGGKTPNDSDVSAIKSLIAEKQDSKQEKVDRVKGNLPLPEEPPKPSDWNSADARTVNVGSGRLGDDISALDGSNSGLREPATAESSVRMDGEQWKTNTAP